VSQRSRRCLAWCCSPEDRDLNTRPPWPVKVPPTSITQKRCEWRVEYECVCARLRMLTDYVRAHWEGTYVADKPHRWRRGLETRLASTFRRPAPCDS
jgi:hypothetical protein